MNPLSLWQKEGFPIDTKEMMNIYLTGSRVYGTQTEKSDYDFYLIVSDDYYKELSKVIDQWNHTFVEDNQCLYYGLHNINLFSFSFFETKLRQNWLQALMCIDLPQEFKIQQDFTFNYDILYRRLGRSIVGEAGKKFEMARRKWKVTWDIYSCKKYIVHSIRDLMLGAQVAKYGKIVDFKEANPLYYEVIPLESEEWKYYEDLYHPVYEKYKKRFEEVAVFPHTDMSIGEFLKKYTVEDLTKYFSIFVKRSGNFLVLTIDPNESPFSHQIVLEANGIVIDEKSGNICFYPPKYTLPWDDHYCDKINWKSAKVFLDRGEEFLHLFSFCQEWCILNQQNVCNVKDFIDQNPSVTLNLPENDENLHFSFLQHEDTLFIHSVRDSQREQDIAPFAEKFQWKTKPILFQKVPNIDFCFWESNSENPLLSMGYYVQDDDFNRIFIAHPQHQSLMKLANGKGSDFDIIQVFRVLTQEDTRKLLENHPNIPIKCSIDFENALEDNFSSFLKQQADHTLILDNSSDIQKFFLRMTKIDVRDAKTILKHINTRDLKKLLTHLKKQ